MDSLAPPVLTQSALDFEGLGKLRAQARQDDKAAVRETAQQFEALFIQMMMKSMREAVPKDEENTSNAEQTFESMFDREVAHGMAKRNSLGLADMLVRDHERRSQMVSTADVLQSRQTTAPVLHPMNAAQPALPLAPEQRPPMALPKPGLLKPLQMDGIGHGVGHGVGSATGGRP